MGQLLLLTYKSIIIREEVALRMELGRGRTDDDPPLVCMFMSLQYIYQTNEQ